jgi:hypothetical protein
MDEHTPVTLLEHDEDLADETLRFWPVRSYLIIYRPYAAPRNRGR